MKVVVLAVLLMLPLQSAGQATFPVQLKENSDIQDIESLEQEVDNLTSKIRQCAAAGLAPAIECHCLYPNKLASTINAYYEVLEKHPEWENRAVLWWDNQRVTPSNLHMGGIRTTIEKPCRNIVSR